MEQKFAMLEIKCENEVEQLKLQNDEKESKQKAVGAKEVQDLKEDWAIKRAKHRRQLAEFNEHTTSECHKIEADTKEQANSLALEKARVLDTLWLSAQEEAALAEAQAEAEVQRFRAKTEATVAHNRAERRRPWQAEKCECRAQKEAGAGHRRERLDVYQALASNKQVVVTDATDAESARYSVRCRIATARRPAVVGGGARREDERAARGVERSRHAVGVGPVQVGWRAAADDGAIDFFLLSPFLYHFFCVRCDALSISFRPWD